MPRDFECANLPVAAERLLANGVRRVIVQRGDASGDQSHVIPVLAVNADIGVLIIDARAPGQEPIYRRPEVAAAQTAPKGLRMACSYVDDFRISSGRIAYVDMKDADIRNCIKLPVPGLAKIALTKTTKMSVNAILASKANRTTIKTQFRGAKVGALLATPEDITLDQFRQDAGINLDRHIVVIWGRKSGKNGGLHPESDSSATGMAQIAQRCMARGRTVLLVGDIVEEKIAKHAGFRDCVHLGKFWERLPDTLPTKGRDIQIRFFYILEKQLKAVGRGLVHVGMRSGGLDMYGFSGQRMIYIAGPAKLHKDPNDKRMTNVVNAFAAAGRVGTYSFEQFHAQHLPKALGIRPNARRGFELRDANDIVAKIEAALTR
jgi:hypothetical protein